MVAARRGSIEELDCRAEVALERARQRVAESNSETQADFYNHAPLSWWRAHWASRDVRREFIERFIRIRDKYDPSPNKLVPFKLNQIQQHLHQTSTRRNVILKARKGGVSRYWLASFFADAVVMSGQNVRIVLHDPDTAEEFWGDLQTMYESLPAHLRPKTRNYSQELIRFFDRIKGVLDSRLSIQTVQPKRENKGRGKAITHLHCSEVPFWPGDARKAFTSLLEAADTGIAVLESTAGGVEEFHRIYHQAKEGKAKWQRYFFEWWWKADYQVEGARIDFVGRLPYLLLPGERREDFQLDLDNPRTDDESQAWAARLHAAKLTKREKWVCWRVRNHLRQVGALLGDYTPWWSAHVAPYLAWRRQKIEEIGDETFAVEYPELDTECFALTGRPIVPARYLAVTCSPSEPVPGHEYAIGVDASLGLEGKDQSPIQVVDLFTGRQAHEQQENLPPDLLAFKVAELSDKYNAADIVPERNGPGLALINKLVELGYETRIYRQLSAEQRRAVEDGKLTFDEAMAKAQFGFQTTAENKGPLAIELERAIRTGDLGLSSQALLDQLRVCVWAENGKAWGARSGYHDDLVLALAIVWFAKRSEAGISRGFVGALPEFGSTEGDWTVTTSLRLN